MWRQELKQRPQRNTAYQLAQLALKKNYLKIFYFLYYVCTSVCGYMHERSARGGQKYHVPLALEVNINGLMWVLGIELKCSMQEQCVLLMDKLHLQPSACFLTQSSPNCLRIASSTVGWAFCINKQSRQVPQTSPQGSLTETAFQPKFPLFRRLQFVST